MILDKGKHEMIMNRILKDISQDPLLSVELGFKGGTCAYLFYALPRFSVDLDFDLFDGANNTQEDIFKRVQKIVEKYGDVKDAYIKHHTIFVLISYGKENHNIKIEINTSQSDKSHYEMRQHLGVSLLIAKKEYMFAMKLVALLDRKRFMVRDVFDVHYFFDQGWEIDIDALEARTHQRIVPYLARCIETVEALKKNQLLTGIGQLIDEKQKKWIKESLVSETTFLLRNYQKVLNHEAHVDKKSNY